MTGTPTSPPLRLILINGVYGAPEHFAHLRECLADHAVTDVFAFRREGGTDPRGPDGFAPVVERLGAMIPATSSGGATTRPVLLGFSLGGALALEYAIEHRERLSALILINAFARFEGDFLQMGSIPALQMWPNHWTHPRLMAHAVHRVAWMKRGLFHPDATRDSIERSLRAATGSMTQDDVRFQLAHLRLPAPAGHADRLATLAASLPVLLISSREDMVVPPRHTERLAAMMPAAERAPAFEGGHAFFQHDARALAALTRSFLARRIGV